jgi:hypothetical protein
MRRTRRKRRREDDPPTCPCVADDHASPLLPASTDHPLVRMDEPCGEEATRELETVARAHGARLEEATLVRATERAVGLCKLCLARRIRRHLGDAARVVVREAMR